LVQFFKIIFSQQYLNDTGGLDRLPSKHEVMGLSPSKGHW